MPVYLYRREDGSTFEMRQKFSDDPLNVDPVTGQRVIRVVQPAGIVFKGSGFYVTDSKGSTRSSVNATPASNDGESKSDTKSESKTDAKAESKPETKKEAKAEAAPAKADARAAAD